MIKIKIIVLLALMICICVALSNTAEGLEKQPYKHIVAIGFGMPFSNAEKNKISPIILYNWYMEDWTNNLYGQFGLTTTRVFYILGYKTNTISIGIIPQLNHTIYGAYHAYDRGVFYKENNFKGNNAGVQLFFQYMLTKEISARTSYYPGYYFYAKNDETTIKLPNNHVAHICTFDFAFDNVVTTNINTIKHGILIGLKYLYSHRVGYSTFEGKKILNSHRRYLNLGIYYRFDNDMNLLLDACGAWHVDVDRNNSDQIGSYTSSTAVMPGYFYGEFYHNKYAISRIQFGMPLTSAWDTRIQPGFNILQMDKKNEVVGVGDYPKQVYKSVSFQLSTKLANTLPLFVIYAYGIDAQRRNFKEGTYEKGHHEILVVALMAFGARQ